MLPAMVAAQSLHEQIERQLDGCRAEVGVAVIIDSRDTVTVNNGSQYPMMSVVKLYQALHVADWLSRRGLSVDTMIHVGLEEMRPDTWSPMRDEYPDGEVGLTVDELLRYTLQQSDNNACDVLFDRTGGPAATDRYIRSLGITDFAIGATEDDMHTDASRCMNNRTTPLSAAVLMERFAGMCHVSNADAMPVVSVDVITDATANHKKTLSRIWQIMTGCRTGQNRLALPLNDTGAVIAHKTGTGDCNTQGHPTGINDVGHVILPDGHHYSIAVFIKESSVSIEDTEKIIAGISRTVYKHVSGL